MYYPTNRFQTPIVQHFIIPLGISILCVASIILIALFALPWWLQITLSSMSVMYSVYFWLSANALTGGTLSVSEGLWIVRSIDNRENKYQLIELSHLYGLGFAVHLSAISDNNNAVSSSSVSSSERIVVWRRYCQEEFYRFLAQSFQLGFTSEK